MILIVAVRFFRHSVYYPFIVAQLSVEVDDNINVIQIYIYRAASNALSSLIAQSVRTFSTTNDK